MEYLKPGLPDLNQVDRYMQLQKSFLAGDHRESIWFIDVFQRFPLGLAVFHKT